MGYGADVVGREAMVAVGVVMWRLVWEGCEVGVMIVVVIVGAAAGGALFEGAIVVSAGGLVVSVVGWAWSIDRAE